MWAAFLLEMILTAVFVWVILAVTDARNEHPALAPAAIGLALTMVHLASIGATGTSVNPARSIGVGVFAGCDAVIQLWLFILAPLVGAAIAGITYPLLFGHGSDPVPGSGLRRGRPRCRATALPTSSSRSGTRAVPRPVPVGGVQEPIIQDGWQWDHDAQEWKPLEQFQQPPAEATHVTEAADPADPAAPPK